MDSEHTVLGLVIGGSDVQSGRARQAEAPHSAVARQNAPRARRCLPPPNAAGENGYVFFGLGADAEVAHYLAELARRSPTGG
jgi:hypothetical protein